MTAEEHREKTMLDIARKRADEKANWEKPELDVHAGLDLLGMTPGVGTPADLLNAALYAAKGDKSLSLLSLSQALPLVGLGTAIGKKAAKTAKSIKKELKRPSDQYRTATGFGESYEYWWMNLNDFDRANPGVVDWNKVTKDVSNLGQKHPTNSEAFYVEMIDYNKENFGGYVTVPKAPGAAGMAKKKGKFARTPDKQKKETLQSRLREQEYQEIRSEEFGRGARGQAITKRSELR